MSTVREQKQYLLDNREQIKKMIQAERQYLLKKGKTLDVESFLRGFMEGIRDKEIPIGTNIVASYKNYASTNRKFHTKTIPMPETRRPKEDMSSQVRNDKVTKEDLRRLKRMQVLIANEQEILAQLGMRFKVFIDGSAKSHVRMYHKNMKTNKITEYIISPSRIINHTQSTIVYKRVDSGATLSVFKENVGKLQTYGLNGKPFYHFCLLMATSLDLRKTVQDSKGKY